MNEEQAVFEQLTLSDFRKWISAALKTFNNYNHNNDQQQWQNKNIMSVL